MTNDTAAQAQVIAEGLEEMLDDHDWLPAANTVLAALAAAGYEVVRLPEPDEGHPTVWTASRGESGAAVAPREINGGHPIAAVVPPYLEPHEARNYAACLLAAARHAEAGK